MPKFISARDVNFFKGIAREVVDDVIENIWTNLAKCQHLGNLKKMTVHDIQMGIHLWRPFLQVEKESIIKTSVFLSIPYLKNTTPIL